MRAAERWAGIAVAFLTSFGVACGAILGIDELPRMEDAGSRGESTEDRTSPPLTSLDGGPAGSLDPSFGGQGVISVETTFPTTPPSLLVDGDAIIVLAPNVDQEPSVAVVRCTRGGSCDSRHATKIPSSGVGGMQAVASRAPGGDGILVYSSGSQFDGEYVARLSRVTRAGGATALATRSVVKWGWIFAIEHAAQSARSIAVDNEGPTDSGRLNFRAYLPDGAVDMRFGDAGVSAIDVPFGVEPRGMVAHDNGQVVVAGNAMTQHSEVYWLRVNDDGGVDPSFGPNGHVGSFEFATTAGGVAADDGGYWLGASRSYMRGLILRLAHDGRLDPSYWDGGVYKFDPRAPDDVPINSVEAVAPQPDGAVLALCTAAANGVGSIVLARVGRNGLDSTFGTNGKMWLDQGTVSGSHAMGIQDDGKIVVTWLGSDNIIKVARIFSK